MKRATREQVEAALKASGGNKAEAARTLKLPRSTLISYMRYYERHPENPIKEANRSALEMKYFYQ